MTLLQQNLFCVDPASPKMALSPQQYLLFWSLHSLSMMDGCTLYEALTTLYSHAQQC
ncbi:MAG: CesT family type III secretion system chaperone [Aeromonas sp.]